MFYLVTLDKLKKNIAISEEEYKDFLIEVNDKYHSSEPIISDDEFDFFKKDFELKYKYSPTKVGTSVATKGFIKVIHQIPMGSLIEFSTTKNVQDEIFKWGNKYSNENIFCISEKLDGISVSIKYESGKYIQALTRGDGEKGEDITSNVAKIENFPKQLVIDFTGFLRGELILTKSSWKKYFPEFRNPRNGAGGLVKRLDGEGCEHLSLFCYKIYSANIKFKSETESLDYIKNVLKINTPRYYKVNIQTAIALHKKYQEEVREKLDYELDGLVVNIDSIEQQEKINDDIYYPNSARKYKFESETAITELLTVKNQVGRTGAITPLAILEPVICGGTLISKATLHNYEEIERLKIRKGDKIIVARSKDVIPKILGVYEKNEEGLDIIAPKNCPECDSILVRKDALLYCENEFCDARNLKSLLHWLNVLNIKNLGIKLLEALIAANKLATISDFYKLKVDDIADLDGQGVKNATKILSELNSKRQITVAELLAGVNIRHLSTKRAEILEDNFGTLNRILELTYSDIIALDGFEKTLAEAISEGLSQKKNQIRDILKYVRIKEKIQGALSDRSFCFSGFRDANLEEKIKENGGKIASGINKKLDYLVVKNKNGTTDKIKKAKEYGLKIIEPDELNLLFFGGGLF